MVRTNRNARFVLGRAKGRGEKKYFPFAIFNLATLKVVIVYCVLRSIKVKSLFMALMEAGLVKHRTSCALVYPPRMLLLKCMIYFLLIFGGEGIIVVS